MFELSGPAGGYVSFALSLDKWMVSFTMTSSNSTGFNCLIAPHTSSNLLSVYFVTCIHISARVGEWWRLSVRERRQRSYHQSCLCLWKKTPWAGTRGTLMASPIRTVEVHLKKKKSKIIDFSSRMLYGIRPGGWLMGSSSVVSKETSPRQTGSTWTRATSCFLHMVKRTKVRL